MKNDNGKMDFDDTETIDDLVLDLPPEEIDRLFDEMISKPAQK